MAEFGLGNRAGQQGSARAPFAEAASETASAGRDPGDGSLNRLSLEAGDRQQVIEAQTSAIMEPIVERLCGLPPEMIASLLAPHPQLQGPAWEAARAHFADLIEQRQALG